MTDPFEHLLRSTLSELAEEAPTVHNPLDKAERRVRNRRTVVASAAGVLAAVLIGAPFALADRGDNYDRPPQPANPSAPVLSPTGPPGPAPSPTESGKPTAPPTAPPGPTSPPATPVPTRSGKPTATPGPTGPPATPFPTMPPATPASR